MHIDLSVCITHHFCKEKRNTAMKKSRLIAFLVVAAMLLSWVVLPESHTHVHATETDTVVTIGSVQGKAGETVTIPVEIENNPGVMAIRVRVYFDDAPVTFVEADTHDGDENPLAEMECNTNYNASKGFCSMLWEADEDVAGDGVIGYIQVTINEDAAPGTYTLRCEPKFSDAFNSNFEEIVLELVNGTITVLCTEHTWGDWTETAAPGCDAAGTKVRVCTVCGTEEEGVIDALGHSFTEYVSNGDATCEADGTETAKCDRCDVTDVRADADSALGHSFTEYVSNGDATCETDGTETATCDRCDETDTRTDVGSKEDAAHSFPAEYTSDGNATCTADGTKSRVCTVCGEKETVTDVGSALGHSFTNYVSNGDATCEADGTETAKCDRCDETDTRTAEGSALGHSYTAQTTEINGHFSIVFSITVG